MMNQRYSNPSCVQVREGKRLVENKVIPEEEYEKGQGVVYPSDADDTSEYLTCL